MVLTTKFLFDLSLYWRSLSGQSKGSQLYWNKQRVGYKINVNLSVARNTLNSEGEVCNYRDHSKLSTYDFTENDFPTSTMICPIIVIITNRLQARSSFFTSILIYLRVNSSRTYISLLESNCVYKKTLAISKSAAGMLLQSMGSFLLHRWQ